MKALPLWQPWATLVVVGAKRFETRHWHADRYSLVSERVAVHATLRKSELYLVGCEPFLRRLRAARDRVALVGGELPLGHLVGTVVIESCRPITEAGALELRGSDPDEHAFGNYDLEEGPRFAWALRDPVALERPVPWKGSQGVFTVPDEVLGLEPTQGALL